MTHFIRNALEPGTSNEVIIKVKNSSSEGLWSFRRSALLKTFPESLLSLTLAQDTTAKEITLVHPDVSPTAVEILYIILEENGDFGPYLDDLEEVLAVKEISELNCRSARYLLIPELDLFSTQDIIPSLRNTPYKALIGSDVIYYEIYGNNLMKFDDGGNLPYLNYILSHTPKELHSASAVFCLHICRGNLLLVQKLVEYGHANPITDTFDSDNFKYCVPYEMIPELQKTDRKALSLATITERTEIVEWLITECRVSGIENALDLAIRRNGYEVVATILKHVQCQPASIVHLDASKDDHVSRIQMIYKTIIQYQENPYGFLIVALRNHYRPGFIKTFLSFLTHPQAESLLLALHEVGHHMNPSWCTNAISDLREHMDRIQI